MNEFLHQLASGLALGGVYAIMALALVMIYQATQLVNFAQGEMAMFSTYFAWKLMDLGWPYWRAFSVTGLVWFVAAAATEGPVGGRSARGGAGVRHSVLRGCAHIHNAGGVAMRISRRGVRRGVHGARGVRPCLRLRGTGRRRPRKALG